MKFREERRKKREERLAGPGLGCWRADSLPMTELPALLGME